MKGLILSLMLLFDVVVSDMNDIPATRMGACQNKITLCGFETKLCDTFM